MEIRFDDVTYKIVDTPGKLAYFTTTTTSYNIMVVKNLDLSKYQWTPICKGATYNKILDTSHANCEGSMLMDT